MLFSQLCSGRVCHLQTILDLIPWQTLDAQREMTDSRPVTLTARKERFGWLKCCFTSTDTVGLLGTGAQDGHLDFHTAPELWNERSAAAYFQPHGLVRLLAL